MFNYVAPFQRAVIFVAFVTGMDFFLAVMLINCSLKMFASLLGTRIPFDLILASIWLTGIFAAIPIKGI